MIESVLVPVLVAAVTTLLIEYAAKPRLEVRKDRILDRDRARRKIKDALYQAEFLRLRLRAMIEDEEHFPIASIEEVKNEYATAARHLWDQAATVRLKPRVVEDLMSRTAAANFAFTGVLLEKEVTREEFTAIASSLEIENTFDLVSDLLETPPYRPLKRRSLRQEAMVLLSDTAEPDDS